MDDSIVYDYAAIARRSQELSSKQPDSINIQQNSSIGSIRTDWPLTAHDYANQQDQAWRKVFAQTLPTIRLEKTRNRFEIWLRTDGNIGIGDFTNRTPTGEYTDERVQMMWRGWLASREGCINVTCY